MNETEAAKIVGIIAQLWPTPPMNDTRAAFFAAALTVIPGFEQAVKAVDGLFLTEHFQPTPAAVIDASAGSHRASMEAWNALVAAAVDVAARRRPDPLDQRTSRALRATGRRLVDLPVNNPSALDRCREKFCAEYIAQLRKTGQVLQALPHRTEPVSNAIDTTAAARKL